MVKGMRLVVTNAPDKVRFTFDRREIAEGMRRGAQRAGWHSFTDSRSFGKPHRSIPTILGDVNNLTLREGRENNRVEGVVPHPGAAIQNFGGTIPARNLAGGLMRFVYFGKLVFTRKKLRPSHIVGKHYIALGFHELVQRYRLVVKVVTTFREFR